MVKRIFDAFDWIIIKALATLILTLQAMGLVIISTWLIIKNVFK